MTPARVLSRVALLAVVSLLSGCVLDRVLDTHDQLCKASPREVRIAGGANESLHVVFDRPTLTSADIEWLAGGPPTHVIPSAEGVRWQYVLAPMDQPAGQRAAFVTELRFVAVDGEMRLAESTPPVRMSRLLPNGLLDGAIGAACHPALSLVPPGARIDLRTLEAGTLPDRHLIESILGPAHLSESDGTQAYRFCVIPCATHARPVARLAYRAGPDGRMEWGEFAYFRYRLIVDRPAGVATLALRL